MNCPNCSELLSERGCFCKFCGSQARCLQCKELLEPAAVACVECGARVGDHANGHPQLSSIVKTALPSNRNTFTYQEDRNSRSFDAALTDDAVNSLGGALTEFFTQRGASRTAGIVRALPKDSVVIEQPKELAAPGSEDQNEQQPPAGPQAAPIMNDKSRILTIFRANGSSLDLIDNRIKAKTGADYLRRLTYLFLYGHELHGRSATSRSEVIAVLKEAKIWDSNAGVWLKKKKGFKVDPDDRLELIGGGRDEAKKALIEILDLNFPDEWNPDTKTVKPRATRKKA